MNKKYVLDTNIPLLMVKNDAFKTFFREKFSSTSSNKFYLNFVSLGELDSITTQNQWGQRKLKALNGILQGMNIIPLVNKEYSRIYADIDSYSQGKLKDRPLPEGMSARNMGKNDLWIAATAAVLKAELLSTDKDFMHLHNIFFKFRHVDIEEFR